MFILTLYVIVALVRKIKGIYTSVSEKAISDLAQSW